MRDHRVDPAYEERNRDVAEVIVQSKHYVRWKLVVVGLVTLGFSLLSGYLILYYNARYAFAAVITAAMCLGIILAPQMGFWLYYWLGFSRPQDVFWGFGEMRISLAVAGIALLSWVIWTGMNRTPWFRAQIQTRLMMGLAAIVLMSGIAHGGDWDRMIEFVKVLVVALAFSSFMVRREWLRGFFWILLYSFGFMTLWANYQHFGVGWPEITGPGISGSGAMHDRNYFAMFLVMGLPVFYGAGRRARFPLLRWAWWSFIPACMYGILLTSSRGGLLGIAGVILAVGFLSRYRVLAMTMGVIGLVGFYVFLAPSGIKERANSIVDYENEASATGRLDSWEAGIAMMVGNPLFGVGPAQYVRSYSQYASTYPRQAHNSWVQIGAEYGVVALLLYGAILFTTIRRLFRIRASLDPDDEMYVWTETILGSLAGYLVCGFFLSVEAFELLYVMVSATMLIESIRRREESFQSDDEDDWDDEDHLGFEGLDR